MVFWGVVLLVVAALLLMGWRTARRGTRTRVTGRNGEVESAIARAQAERLGRINQPGPGASSVG